MKLTVPAAELNDALRKVQSVVSSRTTIPVLSNVLLSAAGAKLTLTTTDLEVSISTTIAATVERDGETTLPAKKFSQIVASLPGGDVLLDTDEQMTTQIHCAHADYKIMGMSAAEFHREGDFQEDQKLTFPCAEFGKILRKVSYAVSTDQTRYVLNGINIDIREGNFVAVATDGRRLALVEKILDDPDSVIDGESILPIKVVNELIRLLDCDGDVLIRLSDSRASFAIGNTLLVTKLVEGTYPTYRPVIPSSFSNTLAIPRETFLQVLNRVTVVLNEGSASVKFSLENDTLTLSARSAEVGEAKEPIEVAYQGAPLEISFNPTFLKDPLKHLDCDELQMRFNDQFKPVLLRGDEGFLYVIMPMRN